MKSAFPKPVRLPSGAWRCQVMVDGKRMSFTADDAMDAVTAALAYRDYGKEKSPRAMTLGGCIDEYILLREAVLSPSTITAYRSYREHRFQHYMGRKVSDLTRRTLQRMVNDETREVSPKTVKNAWTLVASALKEYGVDTSGINLPQIPRNERPWLTYAEILAFCDEVRGRPCEIPALLALCSLRRSEIFGLDWKDVDLRKKTITVRQAMVKTDFGLVLKKTNKTASSSRVVPIFIPQLEDALKAQKPKSGLLVPKSINNLYRDINLACARLGLPQVGVHGLRHSFASLCHHLGIPEMECAKMGGWKDLGTMRKIYTHLSEDQMSDAAAALRNAFPKK